MHLLFQEGRTSNFLFWVKITTRMYVSDEVFLYFSLSLCSSASSLVEIINQDLEEETCQENFVWIGGKSNENGNVMGKEEWLQAYYRSRGEVREDVVMFKICPDPNLFKYIFEVVVVDSKTFIVIAAECRDLLLESQVILKS